MNIKKDQNKLHNYIKKKCKIQNNKLLKYWNIMINK